MQDRFEHYWHSTVYRSRLRYALIFSIVLHFVFFGLSVLFPNWAKKEPPKVAMIQLVQGAETGVERPDQAAPKPAVEPKPEKAPVPTPPPEPEKPKPEPEKPKPEPEKPKPEPKKPEPEKPKPEPKKPEPEKPKPEPKKPEPEKPKPEPKKPEPEKPKPEPKKPEPEKPKPEPKKPEPEKPKPEPKKPEKPKDQPVLEPVEMEDELETIQVAKNEGELSQGSNVEAADFPSALNYWATLVKRKVDRHWVVPTGVSLEAAETKVRVGFWVNREGQVMDDPVIVDGAFDNALRRSCIKAIQDALPLPPFPDGFNEPEQYVTYVFTLAR